MPDFLVNLFSLSEILLLIFEKFIVVFKSFTFQKFLRKIWQFCVQNKTLYHQTMRESKITFHRKF